jgi:hypothetical protein
LEIVIPKENSHAEAYAYDGAIFCD